MPWKVRDLMSNRLEFIRLATQEDANVAQLCRQLGISRKTGSKWLARFRLEGEAGLRDRSRRPRHSPERTELAIEERVLAVRRAHPAWGGRKIEAYLLRRSESAGASRGMAADEVAVPAPSTITAILHRHGQIDPGAKAKHRPLQRFERAAPNELWQMDFKGWFALVSGAQCHPLTILDDHSRFALALEACGNEQGETVQKALIATFRTYGMPHQMLMDNGPPWGSGAPADGDREAPFTWLTVWLMRQGIVVSHGRPRHPQTQGKDERFHRTLKAELLAGGTFRTLREAGERMRQWRDVYNCDRPHEALGMSVPASRYRMSVRVYEENPGPIEYGPEDEVRKVHSRGKLNYRGATYWLSTAFNGEPVAIRRNVRLEDALEVWYCRQMIGHLNLQTKRYERRAVRREE
jgi:transposase InsO family protein